MPRTHILLLFILAFTGVQARITLEKSQLELADPFILLEGDTYYAYGTHSPEGFQVHGTVEREDTQGPPGRPSGSLGDSQ